MKTGECPPPPSTPSITEWFCRLQSKDPGAVSRPSPSMEAGWGAGYGGEAERKAGGTLLGHWLGSCSRPVSLQDGRGVKELIWNCKEFPSEGAAEAMWGSDRVFPVQNAAFFLRNAEHCGESGSLSCSHPKHCLCVSSVLGPPSWTCRSATDLMLSP